MTFENNVALRRSLIAILGLVVFGCRLPRSHPDPQPDRGLFDEHWKGYYFDDVHASFTLPLFNPGRDLRRNFAKPLAVVSSNPDAPQSLVSTPKTPPKYAMVQIKYHRLPTKPEPRVVTVTLHWEYDRATALGGTEVATEVRTVPMSHSQICSFLESSGEFLVDEREHYYRREHKKRSKNENPIDVAIEINGPNEGASFDRQVDYENVAYLYQLVNIAWPTAS